MMDIRTAARLLGGDIIAANKVLCPGPGHSEKDRSLQVTFRANGRPWVKTYSPDDDWQDCLKYVEGLLGLGPRTNILVEVPPADDADREERERKQSEALAIWHQAQLKLPPQAVAYLQNRHVPYLGEALRWHPACRFGRHICGCIVALVRNIITDEPQAIHRTAIDANGVKMDHLGSKGRLALGPTKGGAIKLSGDDAVTQSLGIAEGIESALSIQQLPDYRDLPVWSLLHAEGVKAFPPLRGLEHVVIAADNDPSGTGLNAAKDACRTLNAAGTRVTILCPTRVGDDLNDEVRGYGA